MKNAALVASLLASGVYAYPWVVSEAGVDSSMLNARRLHIRQQPGQGPNGPEACPFNPDHVPAAPVTDEYPYNGARGGLPGLGKGGILVPAVGDEAHKFIAPGPNDIRGPCPGLNAAANHGFLARDGIVTFAELVDAQQNVYNVGHDLAVVLALLGLTLTDGDIVTEKLSIGCDATTRTSFNPALTGSEPGLEGHNKFESDSSLTRNDYFTHDGDNFKFNGTLFGMMNDASNGDFNRENLSKYRVTRYDQSRAENENFFFGPLALLLYGAASFLYELMPSGTHDYAPDLATISAFYGAEKQADGSWGYIHERIPDNWTTRLTPYGSTDVGREILAMYLENPVLFGGNTADGHFDTIDFGVIKDGKIDAGVDANDLACFLYQLTLSPVPSSLNGVITPAEGTIEFILKNVKPSLENLGCPIPLQ